MGADRGGHRKILVAWTRNKQMAKWMATAYYEATVNNNNNTKEDPRTAGSECEPHPPNPNPNTVAYSVV
jgi:hypothetical protein